MNLGDETALEQNNRLLGLLASEAGIQSAFAYLLANLCRIMPVDLILCTFGMPGETLIELARVCRESDNADFEREQLKPIYAVQALTISGGEDEAPLMEVDSPSSRKPLPARQTVSKVFLMDHDPQNGTMLLGLRHAEYRSMMVLPVEREDDAPPMNVTLMSMQAHAFHTSDVIPCLTMTRDLRRVLSALFSLPQAVRHSPRYARQASSVELLRMCRGLADILRLVEKVSPLHATVLVTGETGVGKEIVAEAAHELSPRRSRPFLKLNCGAIPETLIDSTLFGHEKGSFTGAVSSQIGYFEQADGGTLFLDEVGELSPLAQTRLLRVLDRGEVQRVGGTRSLPVDVRVIAATNRDMRQMVKEGRFREDLLFRLSVFPIEVPPLRERRVDIPILTRRFMELRSRALGLDSLPEIPEEELARLYAYDWPGNVRELEHKLEQALIMAKSGSSASPLQFTLPGRHEPLSLDGLLTREPPLTLDELNRLYIERMLERAGYVLAGDKGAARLLGLHPNTLRSRMEQLGIASRNSRGRKRKNK